MKKRPIEYWLSHPLILGAVAVLIVAAIAWAAAWQDYGAFSGDIADTDDWLIRDISATPPANGTIKRLSWSDLKTQIANGADFWTGTAQGYLSNEIVVNDEAGLYSALSDVDRFLEQNDSDPEFGVNDTTNATPFIFGDSGTDGGDVRFYNAANEDTNEEYWTTAANGDQFDLGPTSDPDLFYGERDGTWNAPITSTDLERICHASEPTTVSVGKKYCATSAWDPSSSGLTVNHVVQLVSTGPNVYKIVDDYDGNVYFASIPLPTLEEDEWNDDTGDRLLTSDELQNKIISNSGESGATHFDHPAREENWNWIVTCEAAQNIVLDPNGTEQWYLNGTQLAAGENIQNTACTIGEDIACYSTEDNVYCKSSFSDWQEETP